MTSRIARRFGKVLATLAVAGATTFVTIPTDGCNGTLRLVIEDPNGILSGDLLTFDDGFDDLFGAPLWESDSGDSPCGVRPIPVP